MEDISDAGFGLVSELRSPSPSLDKGSSPGGRRFSDIHIPSPDHTASILSSEHFEKYGLIRAQEAALHDSAILEMGYQGSEPEYAFMAEGMSPKSPSIGSLEDLRSLKPIRLKNLKIGKVHRGRILSGTLCCKSVKIFAVMNVLEEEGTGDATKIVISNAVPRSATTATAQKLYPEHAQLSVREPYLKRFSDGMVGLLVENPADIIFNYLPDEIPSPVSERESILWPVFRSSPGDGQESPRLTPNGSFIPSPSPLGRNLSPWERNFLDEPHDRLPEVRVIRKFRRFTLTPEIGTEDDENAEELDVVSGDTGSEYELVKSPTENASDPCEVSSLRTLSFSNIWAPGNPALKSHTGYAEAEAADTAKPGIGEVSQGRVHRPEGSSTAEEICEHEFVFLSPRQEPVSVVKADEPELIPTVDEFPLDTVPFNQTERAQRKSIGQSSRIATEVMLLAGDAGAQVSDHTSSRVVSKSPDRIEEFHATYNQDAHSQTRAGSMLEAEAREEVTENLFSLQDAHDRQSEIRCAEGHSQWGVYHDRTERSLETGDAREQELDDLSSSTQDVLEQKSAAKFMEDTSVSDPDRGGDVILNQCAESRSEYEARRGVEESLERQEGFCIQNGEGASGQECAVFLGYVKAERSTSEPPPREERRSENATMEEPTLLSTESLVDQVQVTNGCRSEQTSECQIEENLEVNPMVSVDGAILQQTSRESPKACNGFVSNGGTQHGVDRVGEAADGEVVELSLSEILKAGNGSVVHNEMRRADHEQLEDGEVTSHAIDGESLEHSSEKVSNVCNGLVGDWEIRPADDSESQNGEVTSNALDGEKTRIAATTSEGNLKACNGFVKHEVIRSADDKDSKEVPSHATDEQASDRRSEEISKLCNGSVANGDIRSPGGEQMEAVHLRPHSSEAPVEKEVISSEGANLKADEGIIAPQNAPGRTVDQRSQGNAKVCRESPAECDCQSAGKGNEEAEEGGEAQIHTAEATVQKEVISMETRDTKSKEDGEIVDESKLTAAALRIRGNKHFGRQDWIGAIELYTKAIHKALQESKENCTPNHGMGQGCEHGHETESEVVMDYSNRAEAWLRLHHYERAWADAERALSLDSNHLKSLFRKGRALLGVGDYQQALAHLEAAYARAPFDKDLLAAIQLSRIGDYQSRLGIFDLSDYYLRGRFAGEVPTCADYVGPVQVKAASGYKGRGLFLTKHVEAGDLLLVSNPLAMLESKSGSKGRRNTLDASSTKGRLDTEVEEKLVHAVRERAKVSTKNRRRLLALCHGADYSEQTIPSMDLFIPGRRIAPMETGDLEDERIHRIIVRNAIDRNMVSTTLEKRHVLYQMEGGDAEDRAFYGLWVLPSFLNHSCIPNVSMVVIGRALFVFASRDLSAGEELLCSYFNVFQPLPQRRGLASRCWGFSCKCARCLLETRFESSLKKLYSLYSRLEPNPTFVLQFSPYAYKAPAKDLAKELEVIETSKKLEHRERTWLQASFTQLYTVSRDFMGPHGNYPYLETALRAMEIVCPGSNSTLEVGLLARETARKEFQGKKTSHYKTINERVLRISQCIYGKQKTAVLQCLVEGTPLDMIGRA